MRKTMIAASGTVMLLATPAMAAQCIKPTAPPVADKHSLTSEERNAMGDQIDAYIAEMNVYLACLEESDGVARAEAKAIMRAFEAPIADLEIVE